MKLSNEVKEIIKELLQYLGFTQAEFATRVLYQPSSFSELLNPKKNKGIRNNTWMNILTEFQNSIQEKKAYLVQLSLFERCEDLMKEISKNDKDLETLSFQFPVGVLVSQANNYIERSCDITHIYNNWYCPLTIIIGGIQFGKSSFLTRLGEKKKEFGIVKFINCSSYAVCEPSVDQVFFNIFKEIDEDLAKNEKTVSEGFFFRKFVEWANGQSKHIYLVIDDFDKCGDAIPPLCSWLFKLRHHSLRSAFKLSVIVAISGSFFQNKEVYDLLLEQSHSITIHPFSKQEVYHLLRLVKLSEDNADTLFELFRGHPFLTHYAIF